MELQQQQHSPVASKIIPEAKSIDLSSPPPLTHSPAVSNKRELECEVALLMTELLASPPARAPPLDRASGEFKQLNSASVEQTSALHSKENIICVPEGQLKGPTGVESRSEDSKTPLPPKLAHKYARTLSPLKQISTNLLSPAKKLASMLEDSPDKPLVTDLRGFQFGGGATNTESEGENDEPEEASGEGQKSGAPKAPSRRRFPKRLTFASVRNYGKPVNIWECRKAPKAEVVSETTAKQVIAPGQKDMWICNLTKGIYGYHTTRRRVSAEEEQVQHAIRLSLMESSSSAEDDEDNINNQQQTIVAQSCSSSSSMSVLSNQAEGICEASPSSSEEVVNKENILPTPNESSPEPEQQQQQQQEMVHEESLPDAIASGSEKETGDEMVSNDPSSVAFPFCSRLVTAADTPVCVFCGLDTSSVPAIREFLTFMAKYDPSPRRLKPQDVIERLGPLMGPYSLDPVNRSSGKSSGSAKRRRVASSGTSSVLVYAHDQCILWCPEVFEDTLAHHYVGLDKAVIRAQRQRLTCAFCGRLGANIGCHPQRCSRSYHVACALLTSEEVCVADADQFAVFCPKHAEKVTSMFSII